MRMFASAPVRAAGLRTASAPRIVSRFARSRFSAMPSTGASAQCHGARHQQQQQHPQQQRAPDQAHGTLQCAHRGLVARQRFHFDIADVDGEGRVAAEVAVEQVAVDVDGAVPIDRPKMEQDALTLRPRERAAIPESLVRGEGLLDAGECGFDGEGDDGRV